MTSIAPPLRMSLAVDTANNIWEYDGAYGMVIVGTYGVVAGTNPVTWNPADTVAGTLSNGNLTLTGTGSGGSRTPTGFTSGKYYWEATIPTWTTNNTSVGVAAGSANLATAAASSTGGAMLLKPGQAWVNGVNAGTIFSSQSPGATIGVAVDFGAKLIWWKIVNLGSLWNGNTLNGNPTTGTGGISFSALTGSCFPAAFADVSGDQIAANFAGPFMFSNPPPSGFTALPLV